MTGFRERGEPGSGDGFEDGDYTRMGIGRDSAVGWRRWGLKPEVAKTWLDAGVTDPMDAVMWHPAVKPDQVKELVEKGMTASLMARWREHGASVEEAGAGHQAGQKPEDRTNTRSVTSVMSFRTSASGRGKRAAAVAAEAEIPEDDRADLVRTFMQSGETGMSYLRIGWLDEQAQRWAEAGIDALDARDWCRLGLTPREAVECEQVGLGATDVALMWWRAGFGPEEVAAWLGAGLSPEEAAKQKADGVTLEQAQVMRSLRQGERE